MAITTLTQGIEAYQTDITFGDGINVTGEGTFGSLDVSGNVDVDGITNLDVVDIDGAVNMATTLLVSGAATLASAVNSKFVKHVAQVTGVSVNSTAGDSPAIGTFSQPANTIITGITILCAVAPVTGTGDIGYEVGTASSGAQIVATQADEILDGGTTVVVGNVTQTALVLTTQDATTAPISAQFNATGSARNIFCNITNTVNATTAGSFTFVIEYVQVA